MNMDYQTQLDQKSNSLQQLFSPFGELPELEVHPSAPENYRMRAEFRVWHDEQDLYYIMFDQATKERYKVEKFPVASELINRLMPILIEKVKHSEVLRRRIFQIDFLSTLSGEMLVSLLYHRQLDDEWITMAKELKQDLIDDGFNLHLIGRARKQKIVLDQEHVIEKLYPNDNELRYMQVENSFTQPNATVATKMLEWAIDCTQGSQASDLLELYCGNGNFSIALAPNFRQVLATEVAKPSVDSAQFNIAENKVPNLKIARLSAEEITEAMGGERRFSRLEQQEINLAEYDFKTIFIDPPRAGMDEKSVAMVQAYDRILYISCNPETLKENLETLTKTHKITRFAMFDQFPFTHHTEAGVLLERI